jgi:hydroxypyruvate reductase
VIAVGKAAGAMALGAVESLGARLLDGVIVTKPGHVPAELVGQRAMRILESAHPQPDDRSLAAGEAVVEFLTALDPDAQVLFLVSGGASSLLEHLAPGVHLDELQRLNAWAIGSGRPIDEVNALRSTVSRVKGGGLAALTAERTARALMISDVPGDDPAVIGSGLLHAPRSGAPPQAGLPPDIAAMVARRGRMPELSRAKTMPTRIIASVRDACRAAAARGREHGLEVRASRSRFHGDAGRLGSRFARRVRAAPPGTLHIWGGESTMTLPPDPGYGGRNQHLALSAAVVLRGQVSATLLAAGTDGIDGVTADAGAIVDGDTWQCGRDAGLEASQCLARADSGRFLEAAGDLLHTGPTLTNVGDVVFAIRGRSTE